MVINYRVSLAFVKLADGALGDFANGVIAGLGLPAFVDAPVSPVALGTLRSDFIAKLAAMVNGGKLATAEKNLARTALLAALRAECEFCANARRDEPAVAVVVGLRFRQYRIGPLRRWQNP
ncbi:MAG: hypothetical protein QM813_16355 [Verrucomicrobiota bacterium]